MNERLPQIRDAAARAGLPVKYYLLQDVVSGKAPGADIYLFLNAFKLGAEDRARLRGVLEANQANAIWMYAPGYYGDDGASVDNIAQLTGIHVKAFDNRRKRVDVCADRKWLEKDATFGGGMTSPAVLHRRRECGHAGEVYVVGQSERGHAVF